MTSSIATLVPVRTSKQGNQRRRRASLAAPYGVVIGEVIPYAGCVEIKIDILGHSLGHRDFDKRIRAQCIVTR